MSDYNIYIHSDTFSGDGLSDKTTPSANKPTADSEISSFTPMSVMQNGISKAIQFESGGFNSFINTGVSMLAKQVPYIAIGIMLYHVTEKIVTNSLNLYEQYTGNYTYSLNFNNFKTMVGNFMNPISLWRYNNQRTAEFNANNKRIEQQRTLIGNTFSNIGKRGV